MGKSQRDKGMRREREFASLIGSARVLLSGAMNGCSNLGFRSRMGSKSEERRIQDVI